MEHMSIRLPFLGFTQNNMHPVVVSAAKIANAPRDLRYAKRCDLQVVFMTIQPDV